MTQVTTTLTQGAEANPPALLSPQEWAQVAAALDLSPQQANVVRYMLEGCQDKEIAERMGVTVPTVRTYLARVFDRTQVKSRVQLAVKVLMLVRR